MSNRKPRQSPLGKQAKQQLHDWHSRRSIMEDDIVKENDLAKSLRDSLLILFSRVDSVLSNREIECSVSDNVGAAATDGTNIYFNENLVDMAFRSIVKNGRTSSTTFTNLIKLRGLNYHELAHILYTPRRTSKFMKDLWNIGQINPKLTSVDAFHAFNILEDARIESMFTAKYPASIPYFIHTVTELIAKDTSELDTKFPLLYGRKYYPQSIRNRSEKLFVQNFKVSAKDLKTLKKCIDDYRGIIFPKHSSDALKIVETFGILLGKIFGNNIPPHGSDNHGQIQGGTTEGIREQQKVQDQLESLDEQLDGDEDEDEDSSSDSQKDSDDSENDRHESSEDAEDAEDSEDSEDSEESDSDDEDAASDDSNSNRGRSAKSSRSTDQEADKELSEILEQTESSLTGTVSKEIKQLRQTASASVYKRFFDDVEEPNSLDVPPQSYRALANTISTALSKLKADTDNQWDKDTNMGNLNVIKKAQSRGLHTDFFDQWIDEGDERPDAEVVILLDQSSSMHTSVLDWEKYAGMVAEGKGRSHDLRSEIYMGTLIAEASRAMWSIKYACQTQDIPCTVIGYSDEPSALMTNSTKVLKGVVPIFGSHGSTYVAEALHISEQLFAKSTAKYKLLVTITDGEWTDSVRASQIIQNLNKAGCHTVLIGLATGRWNSSQMLEPQFPPALTKPTREHYWNGTKNEVVNIPLGYGCKSVLAVTDCRQIAKKVGSLLVKGVVNSR